MIYFSSDHHFFHANIIKYCNRPFVSVELMNDSMIHRWNSIVMPDDCVYYLGDMFMGQKENWLGVRNQLNGRIFFVIGNHDRRKVLDNMGFESVVNELCLNYQTSKGEVKIFLHHQPNFEKAKEFDFHFCGHVHGKWVRKENIINVGVDVWDFMPRKFEELISAAV